MTDPTGAVGATGAASQAAATAAATNRMDSVNSDTFLKLLVAQLKYQDPSKPTDSTQFLAQTAQFQMVEKLNQLATENTQLVAAQQSLSALALVGRSVTYQLGGADGRGVVSSVHLAPTGPTLTIGGHDVPMSAVTDVRSA